MKRRAAPRIVIIGAGPTGLGAAWRLRELGVGDVVLLERAGHPGGLAASYADKHGFLWDTGGHVIHSHYPYFDRMFDAVMQGDVVTHERESWVWVHKRFVPYPFQNNIHRLPKRVTEECLAGLRAIGRQTGSPGSFAEWLVATYGAGIARHFLLPYNRKVWACDPARMDYRWTADRVSPVDIGAIERNIRTKTDDVSWGPNRVFRFPLRGATGDLWNRIAARVAENIRYHASVVRIDAKRHVVTTSGGSEYPYDVLLSTMPLDRLSGVAPEVGIPMPRGRLVHSSVTIVGLGLAGSVPHRLATKCWMYFPDAHVPFYRATIFSNYSPNNAPPGTWSFMAEISSSRTTGTPPADPAAATEAAARKEGLIPHGGTVVAKYVRRVAYGYPTPTLGRDAYLAEALPAWERYGIFPRGRFGAWKYEVSNMDHSFMQGVEWANRVTLGTAEVTVWKPEAVNGPVPSRERSLVGSR